MSAIANLLALYRVDQQLRGLSSRLRSAETYFNEQDRLVADIKRRHDSLSTQLRQLAASAHNEETESKGIESRIAMLRERMNSAQTSKEHAAHLTEINTLKADKGLIEDRALEAMNKVDAIKAQVAEIDNELAERQKVRDLAAAERTKRAAEIKDRLAELQAERIKVLADVPPMALAEYEHMLKLGIEDVMAPIEEQSRRSLEYTCGACYTHLPVEQVSILLKRGDITKCPACRVILYMEDSLHKEITASNEKKNKRRVAVDE